MKRHVKCLLSVCAFTLACKTTISEPTTTLMVTADMTDKHLNKFAPKYEFDAEKAKNFEWSGGPWAFDPTGERADLIRESIKHQFVSRIVPKDSEYFSAKAADNLWAADQMFTKALDKDGNHVRVDPYFRIVGYGSFESGHSDTDTQKISEDLRRIMKPGDIIVFWHPEWNDFTGDLVQKKEMTKIRSTHAGLTWYHPGGESKYEFDSVDNLSIKWYDGKILRALNSPQDYHDGWFDNHHNYPFHIFRMMPNPKNKDAYSDKFQESFSSYKGIAELSEKLATRISLYAARMNSNFQFPGDYNGGDPLNLSDLEMMPKFHERIEAGKMLAEINSDGRRVPANLYCAEYVWTSSSLALNSSGFKSELSRPISNFPYYQYNLKQDTFNTSYFKSMSRYLPWKSEPSFLFKPYTVWDLVESFVVHYFQAPISLDRRMVAGIITDLKPELMDLFSVDHKPFDSSKDWASILSLNPTDFQAAMTANQNKTDMMNFMVDAVIATFSLHNPEQNDLTSSRKAMVKTFADKLLAKDSNSRFLYTPPHAFMLEANNLNSDLVYVATAFPDTVLKEIDLPKDQRPSVAIYPIENFPETQEPAEENWNALVGENTRIPVPVTPSENARLAADMEENRIRQCMERSEGKGSQEEAEEQCRREVRN